MLNHIWDYVYDNSIGGMVGKDKSKLKNRLFSKFKTSTFERRSNDDFKTLKIFKIGKIVLEKIASKGKMVRFNDHLSATG